MSTARPEETGKGIAGALADALEKDYRARARPSQLPPSWQWLVWLILTGRGWGKTWTASSWTNEVAMASVSRIALIGATASDARDTMIEGETGILRTAPAWFQPVYEPSRRQISWPNGSIAQVFSAEEPDRLRGPQFHYGWLDELAAFPNDEEVWNMFQFGLRLGHNPQAIITTTPRPKKLIRSLIARDGVDVAVVRGSTFENAENLAPGFLEAIKRRYQNTRLGRQELNGEVLFDVAGALWTREMLDRANGSWKLPDMKRVVVAIDPSGTRGEEDSGDSVGIVVAGLGADDFGYVLADKTCKLSPDGWGRVAVQAYRDFKADRIVAERNFGGAMVEHTIKVVDRNVSYKEVVASRGKVQRAEPISALYEQNRIRHVGTFVELEDQLAAMTSDGYVGDGSPDRVDALVWALSELMVSPEPETSIQVLWGAGQILGYGRSEREPDVEANYGEAEIAAARGELRGAQLRWFLSERQKRNER
jgi:phage terminase large subunit-like protein